MTLNELKKAKIVRFPLNKNIEQDALTEVEKYIEITIDMELQNSKETFAIISIKDIHYYINKKLSKKEISKVVEKALNEQGYTHFKISRGKVAIYLENGMMKKPKLYANVNVMSFYFMLVAVLNIITIVFKFVESSFKINHNIVSSSILCIIAIYLCCEAIYRLGVTSRLYRINKKIIQRGAKCIVVEQ